MNSQILLHRQLLLGFICLFLQACTSPDANWDKADATNAFDTEGFRHGKWVMYSSDSTWMTLTEYDHGYPTGIIRDYNDTTLRESYSLKVNSPRNSSFQGEALSGASRDEGLLVGTHIFYDELGQRIRKISFRDDDTIRNKTLNNPFALNFRPAYAQWNYADGRTINFTDRSDEFGLIQVLNSDNRLINEVKLYFSPLSEYKDQILSLREMMGDKELIDVLDPGLQSSIEQFQPLLDFLPMWGYSFKIRHSISLSGESTVDTTWTWPKALYDINATPTCKKSCTQEDAFELFWNPTIQAFDEAKIELEKQRIRAQRRRNNPNKSGLAYLDLDYTYRCPYCNSAFPLKDGFESELCGNYVRDQTPNLMAALMGKKQTCHDVLQEYYGNPLMRNYNIRPNRAGSNLFCSRRCYELDRYR